MSVFPSNSRIVSVGRRAFLSCLLTFFLDLLRCWWSEHDYQGGIDKHPNRVWLAKCVEQTIGVNTYQQAKVNQWTSNIVESCLKRLCALNKPFKYIGLLHCEFNPICVCLCWIHLFSLIPANPPSQLHLILLVNAVIMQKNGAGLHTASSCFWDNSVDGDIQLRPPF